MIRSSPTKARLSSLLTLLVLCMGSVWAQMPTSVDVRLVVPNSNTLAVQVRPNGSSFADVMSGLTLTIRWSDSSPALLGTRSLSCPVAVPLNPTNMVTTGGFKYRTYNSFGSSLLLDEGCQWPADQWVTIATIPVLNNTECAEFAIVNDAWTTANSRNFFCTLNGIVRTGLIVGAGLFPGCTPEADAADIRLVPGPAYGPGVMVAQVRSNTQAFSGVVSDLSFTVAWPSSSPAFLGDVISLCPQALPFVAGSTNTYNGSRYRTFHALGSAALGGAGCSWPADQWVSVCAIPTLNNADCAAFAIVNNAYTSVTNGDHRCVLSGVERTGAILGSAANVCSSGGTGNVDVQLVRSSTNTLAVRARRNGASLTGVLSGLTLTIRWPASSPALLGTRTLTCPFGVSLSPTTMVTNGGYKYRTYNAFGTSLLSDEGCPWSADQWVTLATIPVVSNTDCAEFAIVNDAWTAPNSRNFFCTVDGVTRTGVIVSGAVDVCSSDCAGIPGGIALPGTACDDINASTANDQWSAGCVCLGANSYCVPISSGFTSFGYWIDGVQLGAISNTGSGPVEPPVAYTDFSATFSAGISLSRQYQLTITPGPIASTAHYAAWIDHDRNGVFSADEKLGEVTIQPPAQAQVLSFTVPGTASTGSTMMRVRGAYFFPGDPDPMDPCFNYAYSEVEDYGIVLDNDDCSGLPGGTALPGSACNDGNAGTIGDVWSVNCQCAGYPPNDAVCGALPLSVGTNGPFTNVNATVQPGEAAPPQNFNCNDQLSWCTAPDQTVWFSFTAPPSGRVSLNFGATQTWDSEIALWSAPACGALLTGGATLVAANDDLPGVPNFAAAIAPVCVTPGATYFVQVDGHGEATNAAFELVLVEEAGIGSACDDGDANTVNDVIQASCICQGVALTANATISVLLEGAYDAGTGLMRDDLRAAGLIPLTEPYSALGYSFVNGGGGEVLDASLLTATGPSALVDWVVLELRSSADPATIVASRAGLVRRDGIIVTYFGSTFFSFAVPPSFYYVAVRHRNHLGCMTAAPVSLGPLPVGVDLRTSTTLAYGGPAARKTISSVVALWAGDVTFNGHVKYTGSGNDRDPILTTVGSTTPNNTVVNTYSTRDVNLNGQVKYTGSANDRDPILVNVGSTSPNNIRVQQLP